MSVNAGYAQYLRKYRLLITSKNTISVKTQSTVAQVPAVSTQTTYAGKVTASSLYVRAAANTKAKKLTKLKKGAAVKILLKQGSWYKLDIKGKDGYVKTKYVKVSGAAKIPTTQAEAAAQAVQQVETIQTTTRSRSLEITKLRVVFKCEKSVSDDPNYSVFTVYNMAQSDIAGIKAGDTVVLEAGYENGNYGMIFSGQIVQPYVTRESGTDTALNLVIQDGDQFLNSAFVMTTLSAACTQADVVAACVAGDDSVSTGLVNSSLSSKSMIRGKVLFGSSAYYMQQAASGVNAQFYVEDGKVNIVGATDYASDQAVELNPLTGLVDVPGQTDEGVSAKCLINPSLKLNTLVHIDSSLITQKEVSSGETEVKAISTDGVYKIEKLTITGDTHGDDWYMEFDAVTQSGKAPGAMIAGVTNPWR